MDKSIKIGDLLLGDKNAVLIAARILAYGKDYEVEINNKKITVDLTKLKDNKIDENLITKNKNQFHFELPATKRKITFKLLNSNDERIIEKEIEGYKKMGDGVGYELTTRFKHQILSIDGDTEKSSIINFVDNEFLSRDSLAFRTHISKVTPDVDMKSYYVDDDGSKKEFTVPMTVSFLWPTA